MKLTQLHGSATKQSTTKNTEKNSFPLSANMLLGEFPCATPIIIKSGHRKAPKLWCQMQQYLSVQQVSLGSARTTSILKQKHHTSILPAAPKLQRKHCHLGLPWHHCHEDVFLAEPRRTALWFMWLGMGATRHGQRKIKSLDKSRGCPCEPQEGCVKSRACRLLPPLMSVGDRG